MSSSSRIAPARRRARFLKIASAGAAAAGFVVLSGVVRGAHGGGGGSEATVPSSGPIDVSSRIADEASQSDSFFQGGSVAPSQSSSPPQADTRTS